MKRGGPLRRTTPLRRLTKLVARTKLRARPKPRQNASERDQAGRWHAATVARGCEVCPNRREACEGRIEAHHVVPQQTLRKRGLTAALWDVDNGMGACYRAHRRHTSRVQPIERDLLRPEHHAFALVADVYDVIERLYPAE